MRPRTALRSATWASSIASGPARCAPLPSRLPPAQRPHEVQLGSSLAWTQGRTPVCDTPLSELEFCVVDVETTGLSPNYERIVEIACVRIDAAGNVIDELATLIDPEGPVGPTAIHGVSQADVAGAPRFTDVAPELLRLMSGAAVAAHNARFDVSFVRAELERAARRSPDIAHVCTMGLRRPVGLPGPTAHKLMWACWQEGIHIESAHAALCDARATGALLSRYLLRAQDRGLRTLGDLTACGKPADSWQLTPIAVEGPRGTVHLRPRPASARQPSLHRALAAPDEAVRSYAWHLAEAAADFETTEDEVLELAALSGELCLTSEQVRGAHEAHLRQLFDDRIADGLLTWAEEQEIRAFGRLLGVGDDEVAALLASADGSVEIEGRPSMASEDSRGSGLTVCFTGEFVAMPLTRDEVSQLAEDAGMTVLPRVTKKLDVLVCLDPHSGTTKARTAESYGTVVIDQPTFLGLAGVQPAPEGVIAAVFEQLAARRDAHASEAQRRKEEAAQRNRERSRERATARREQQALSDQVLWCAAGSHEWSRTPQRGRPPKACPDHTPVPA